MMQDENPELENSESIQSTPQNQPIERIAPQKREEVSLISIYVTDEGLEQAKTLLTAWVPDVPLSIIVIPSKESHVTYFEQNLASDDTFTLSTLSETIPIHAGNIYVLSSHKSFIIRDNHLTVIEDSSSEEMPGESFLANYGRTLKQKAFVLFFAKSIADFSGIIKLLASCNATLIHYSQQHQHQNVHLEIPVQHLVEQSSSIRNVALSTQRFIESFNPDTVSELQQDPNNVSYVQHITSILNDVTPFSLEHFNPQYVLFHVYPRMRLHGFEGIHEYIEKLATDKEEATRLALRISIRSAFFFNDLRSLRVIAKTMIPSLVKEKNPEESIRIWIPGCSSGEDILSLSMLIHEHADSIQTSTKVQFLGTDETKQVLDFALSARYSAGGIHAIPEILKEKFFALEEGLYQYEPVYFEQCQYSVAALVDDSPPQDVDIIYCKDVLPILASSAQEKLLGQFKESLSQNGLLVLGSNEGHQAHLPFFVSLKNQPYIYKAIQETADHEVEVETIQLYKNQDGLSTTPPKNREISLPTEPQSEQVEATEKNINISALHKDLLLQIQAPVSLMIRPDFSIVDHIGNVGRFLAWPNNGHTMNMLEAFPKEVREDLRFAVNQVLKSKVALKSRPIDTKYNGIFREFRLQVHPINLDDTNNSLIQIIFVEAAPIQEKPAKIDENEQKQELEQIKSQLEETKQKFKVVSDLLKDSKELLKQAKNREKKALDEVSKVSQKSSSKEFDKISLQNKELRSTNTELLELNRDLVRRIEELRRNMNRKLKEIEAERAQSPAKDKVAPDSPSPVHKNLSLLIPKRHEVRTSLTSIIGFADLLAERIVDKDNRELAKYIGKSGHRLSENLAPLLSLEFSDDETAAGAESQEVDIDEDIVSSNRVLVVEDSDATRRLLTLVLSDRFECEVASDGSEAIKKAEKEIFKAVLMDIDLGKGPNGIDVLDHLRQKNYYRTVPFMAVTSMATPQDRSMLLRKGFDAFVPKPFQKGLLLSTLDKMIDNSAGFA